MEKILKRFLFIMIVIGFLFTIGISLVFKNIYFSIAFFIPYGIAMVFKNKIIIKKKYLPISVILLWSTIYNVFYLSQCKTELDDYYSFGQILFRLALPLIIGIIANKILTKPKKN